MRSSILIVALMLCASTAMAQAAAPDIVVEPAWLAEHLQDPSLVVLHVTSLRADYDRAHIPGSRFLWLDWIVDDTPEASFELPPAATLVRRFESLGISNSSQVVLVGVLGNATGAARAWFTLDYLGMGARAHILDGGLEAWQAEGRPVSTEPPQNARRGHLVPALRPEVLADLAYVTGHYRNDNVRLVDARPDSWYRAPARFMWSFRGGHIPGAVDLFLFSLMDSTGRYLPPDSLRARFAAAGVQPGQQIITYCGIGQAAAVNYVAARMLGYPVRLYDGSFEEWSRRTELPVEGEGGK